MKTNLAILFTFLAVNAVSAQDAVLPGASPPPAGPAPERAAPAAGEIPMPPRPAPRITDAELIRRLEALRPDDPEAYFLLAEEVADTAADRDATELARTLYVLAFHLDLQRAPQGAIAASAAVGLAQIERLERDRRWLLAMAGTIDRRYAAPDWNVPASLSVSEETAYLAAAAIGLARSGDGRDAKRLLDDRGVRDLLRRYERAIGSSGETGALFRIEKYTEQWPCRECGNSRVVTKPTERGAELRLCSTCRGNPGPRLSEEEFIAQLRFESYLLSGIQRSWAAQEIVDQGAPLRDPDPADVADTFGIDVNRCWWRGGQWVARP
jgi:hypothetical protein